MADGLHLKINTRKEKKVRKYTLTNGNNPIPMYTVEVSKKSKPHAKVIKHGAPSSSHPTPPPPVQYPQPPPYGFDGGYNRPQQYNQQYHQPYNPSYQPYNQPCNQNYNNYQPPPPSDRVVGTMTFHELSSKIDVSFNGTDTSMKRSDPLAGGRKFQTPTMGKLQWKEDGLLGSNQKLVDENRNVIAKYKKKDDEIIVLLPPHQLERNLDMIVVTGMAIVESEKKSDSDGDAAGDIIEAIIG
ncbi:hypothetical protein FQN49_003256 [Arthroderma sp. PD_2]|nr:hypothetical protein FQN49_003256 [Arthroderma sp. PD_2]